MDYARALRSSTERIAGSEYEIDIVATDLNYWIKHPFEFSDQILKPEYL